MKDSKYSIKAKWEKSIEVLKVELQVLNTIEKVAKKFDGKVINKRFVTALSSANDSAHFNLEPWEYSLMVQYSIKDSVRQFRYKSPHAEFANSLKTDVGTYRRVGTYIKGRPKLYINMSDRRLEYDKLQETIGAMRDFLNGEILKYKNALDNFEKNMEKIMAVNKEIAVLKKEFKNTPFELETDHIEIYNFSYDDWYNIK